MALLDLDISQTNQSITKKHSPNKHQYVGFDKLTKIGLLKGDN